MTTYECRCEGYEPHHCTEIEANSPREAAEKFRQIDDARSVEWPYESNVIVCLPDGSEVTFTVTCESVPVYSAKLKRPAA